MSGVGWGESEALALGQGWPGQPLMAPGSHTASGDRNDEPEPAATHCEVWPQQRGKQGRGWTAAGPRTESRHKGRLSGRPPPCPGDGGRTKTAAFRGSASTNNEGFCLKGGVFEEGWPGRRGGTGDLG